MKIRDLKSYHVSQWLERRTAGTNYRHNLVRAVKACFAWAEQQEYVEQSPLRNLKVPAAASRGDEAYLTPEQWNKVVSATCGSFLDLLTVMHETGCRPQEARRVESRHFDRAGRCWILPKSEAKGGREARVIHLSDRAFEICQRLALANPDGPMFCNSHGKPWSARVLAYRCQRLSRRIGFEFTSYSVRHSFATDAILRGVDLQTVATILGHRNLNMLSKVYQHISRCSDHIKEGVRRATA